MDKVGDPGEHAGVGLWEHAVAEVEHVPLGHPPLVEHLPDPRFQYRPRR